MRRFICLVPLLLAACHPKNVPRTACHDEVLGVADPWFCTVTAESLEAPSSVAFDTESRNKVAQVKINLAVAKGTLRIGYFDVGGQQQVTLTPDDPLTLAIRAPLDRDRRSFTLSFNPEGRVEGLSGTVNYSTP